MAFISEMVENAGYLLIDHREDRGRFGCQWIDVRHVGAVSVLNHNGPQNAGAGGCGELTARGYVSMVVSSESRP